MVRHLIAVLMPLPCVLILGVVPAAASTGWVIQPTPNPTAAHSTLVSVSCSSASACTAVGYQPGSSPHGHTVPLAERWNGTRWSIQPIPYRGALGSMLSGVSCASATSCTAVGTDTTSTGVLVTLAEHWNGTRWSIQPTPNPAPGIQAGFDGVSCRSAAACIAVGSYINNAASATAGTLAEQWNGSRWTIENTPDPTGAAQSALQGVSCPSATSCTAAGWYFVPLGQSQTLAERWNGTRWTIQPTPNPTGAHGTQLTGVSCSSATACTAVGWYGGRIPAEFSLAERWNGTSWAIQPTPNPAGAVDTIMEAVSCGSATECTAVGVGTGSSAALAESWNGAAWVIETTPTPAGAAFSELSGVSCVAATTCTATGHYDHGGTSATGKTLAEHK